MSDNIETRQNELKTPNDKELLKTFDSFYIKLKESISNLYKTNSNATNDLEAAFERLERVIILNWNQSISNGLLNN